MATLTIFRNAFVTQLRHDIPLNLPRYVSEAEWTTFLAPRSKRDLDTKLNLSSSLSMENPDGDELKDLENAIRVHKHLRLTPLQARDPRLWTRLSHVECWGYMRSRWPVEKFADDNGKRERFVATRYFVLQNESRALLRNGIARLWWTANLTFDPDRSNGYELTAVLLSTLDITQQLLERNMGRSQVILRGFLEFLSQRRSELLIGGEKNRERIRKLAKFLNMYGGVCLLDCLTETQIIKILEAEYQTLVDGD